ncbi:hypothetical protein GCM10028820_30800 [Tessaracoccus terricola]
MGPLEGVATATGAGVGHDREQVWEVALDDRIEGHDVAHQRLAGGPAAQEVVTHADQYQAMMAPLPNGGIFRPRDAFQQVWDKYFHQW